MPKIASCSALLVEMVSISFRLAEIDDIIKDSLTPASKREDTIARLLTEVDRLKQRKRDAKAEFGQLCQK